MSEVMTGLDEIELRRQVERDRQIAADLRYQQEAATRVTQGETLLSDIARKRQMEAELDASHKAAKAAVEQARPEIAAWRSDFASWLVVGQQLLRRLQAIEGPLWTALNNAVAYVGRHSGGGGDDSNLLTDKHLAMDNALVEVGGVDPDLWPLPPDTSDAFALEATAALVSFAGNVYAPWLRVNQFLRHGFSR